MMRTSFDPEADAFYARFAADDVAIVHTQEVAPGLMLDLDATGNLVGVEVLSISARSSGTYAHTSQTAKVERHAVMVDRPVSGMAFTDQTIEMTQTGEEAVVGRTAHVREEVILRRETADRVEMVKDGVRREDVRVEQMPTSRRVSHRL